MDRAGFLAHLAELGIPHDQTLRELEARYGVRQSTFYSWDVIAIADARPMVPGQVEPPDFQTRLQPDLLPAPGFSALVSAHAEARKSHASTLAHLTKLLGVPAETSVSNTLEHVWTFGTAFVRLTTWPPELRRLQGSNPAHERHPELKRYSHLEFGAGHVVALSAQERDWMSSATQLSPQGAGEFELWLGVRRHGSPIRGCFRRLPPGLSGYRRFVGISGDSAALVGMHGEDGFVLPKDLVVRVELQHLAPARGPGGSRLVVRYRDPFTSREAKRSKDILFADGQSSLDETAQMVADWAAKELRVFEYLND